MFGYLVEAYFSSHTARQGAPNPQQIAEIADQLTREGKQVRLVQAVVVPEDEMCLYLFEAASSAAVLDAASRSGLRFERYVEAVSAWSPAGADTTSGFRRANAAENPQPAVGPR